MTRIETLLHTLIDDTAAEPLRRITAAKRALGDAAPDDDATHSGLVIEAMRDYAKRYEYLARQAERAKA